MNLKKSLQLVALCAACSFCLAEIGNTQDTPNQNVPKPAEKKDQKQDQNKDQKQDQKKGQNQGDGAGSDGGQQKDKPAQNSPNSSRLQVLYPPTDIVVQDGNCESQITALSLRSTAKELKLQGPAIVGGSLQDKDSSSQMPAQAFHLLQKQPANKDEIPCSNYSEITPDSKVEIPDDLTQSPFYIGVRSEWVNPGVYSGNLWIAARGDSAAQSVALKVVVRPWYAWVWGILAIVVGALISWFAVVYVVRQRQMAANRILIVRLRAVLDALTAILQGVTAANAPSPVKTLQHIQQIRDKGLQQLLDDKELSVLAGITVPPTGAVTMVDDINGVNSIVQNGFAKLLDLWEQSSPNPPDALKEAFSAMDSLGAEAQPLLGLDQKIQSILSAAAPATKAIMSAPAELPSEEAIVHQVKTTTVMLDVLSLLAVVLLGIYALIWKNPGFGSAGNYIEALLWGLGLKLGGDVTKLGPSDVRTAFGIKVPGPTP